MNWRAELVAVWAFALRNLLMASRNVFFLFELAFWPVVGVLSIGLMSRFLTLSEADAAFILTGTIALSTVQVCQLDVAYAVLFDVWSKSMKHQFLAPIGVRHLTTGSWLIGVLRGVIVFALLAGLARAAFGFDPLQGGVAALAVFLLGCFLTAWAVFWLVLHDFPRMYGQIASLADAYASGRYEVVEGNVAVLKEQPAHGHTSGDRIMVGGKPFEVDHFLATPAYHDTIAHGGVLKSGVYARLSHVDGKIVRVEIRKSSKE